MNTIDIDIHVNDNCQMAPMPDAPPLDGKTLGEAVAIVTQRFGVNQTPQSKVGDEYADPNYGGVYRYDGQTWVLVGGVESK